MTSATPISVQATAQSGRQRLAVMPGKPNCRHHNLKLLVTIHARMQRVLVVYAQVSEAIVRKLEGAA